MVAAPQSNQCPSPISFFCKAGTHHCLGGDGDISDALWPNTTICIILIADEFSCLCSLDLLHLWLKWPVLEQNTGAGPDQRSSKLHTLPPSLARKQTHTQNTGFTGQNKSLPKTTGCFKGQIAFLPFFSETQLWLFHSESQTL